MAEPVDLEALAERAREMGAQDAKPIDPRSIVTAAWVRLKCQFGCGGFGSSLCCPPHSPTPEQTQRVIDCYQRAILIHCLPGVSVKEIVAKIERLAFLAGAYKALGLGSGPCRLCETCTLRTCIHPRRARPSMEACGIDVYATARANGLPIEVVTDR
ncbi:MAG: DUF2284 domain-containing protein [Armatimonadota bacterium]